MRRAIAAACSSVAPKISSRWKLPGFLRTSSTLAFIWSSRGRWAVPWSITDLRSLDPPLPDRVHDRLRAVVHRQLSQDARHVILHGLLGDGQRVGDLFVRHALRDVVQDLHLTGRERRKYVCRPWTIHGKLAELSEHLRRDRRPAEDLLVDDELAGPHLADGIDELGGLAVLVEVGGGASADRLEEDLLLILGRQDDDTHGR